MMGRMPLVEVLTEYWPNLLKIVTLLKYTTGV